MSGLVRRLEPLAGHVGVNLGRADAGVTQNLLDTTQIGTPVQQVSGGRVAQGVRPFRSLTGDFPDDA